VSVAEYPYFGPPPLALAHRGGAGYRPNHGIENTLVAFANAVGLGYRYLETDVQATSDGQVIAFHDPHLDRVTDRTGAVAELTWREVRAARIGGREPVPLLVDLLEAFPNIRFNIDIKAPGAVDPLWRIVQRHHAYDRVCVGSFSDRRLASFRRLAGPRVATAAGPSGAAALRFWPRSLSGPAHSPAQVLQIPATLPLPRGRALTIVTPGVLARAHGLGMQVHVWTVDDPREMTRLLDLGVDGLVSDRIDVLKDLLVARGCWTGD
jgi:glycerophosphoryl diester phosphodiesterase